jgi:hypothetical protein
MWQTRMLSSVRTHLGGGVDTAEAQANEAFHIGTPVEELLAWRDTVDFPGPVYAGVMAAQRGDGPQVDR